MYASWGCSKVAIGAQERYFSPSDLPRIEVAGPGVYAVAKEQPDATFSYAGKTADGATVWCQPQGVDRQIPAIITARQMPGILGIALIAKHTNQEDGLSLAFSQYLTELRTKKRNKTLPCVISSYRPELPSGYVRLPHLAAYVGAAPVADMVMWEILIDAEAEQWLGRALPNQEMFEENLQRQKALRGMICAGQNITNEAYRTLTTTIQTEGRYLSILFAYQHAALFQTIFEQWPTIQKQRGVLQ